jgi:endonuclease/exonuclease/phosphatase family metal-dependent hydrolase
MARRVVRVLSYNIHKGFSIGNRRFVLSQIREALQSIPVDIVFLQEVLGHHDEHAKKVEGWPLAPQFEFLADQVWPHYAYGKNAVYEAGHHGNAILSKFPILEWSNIDLSTNQYEQRGCLHISIDVPGLHHPVHCMCVHLNLLHGGRRSQIHRVCSRISSAIPENEPFFLAGDFNDWSQRASAMLEEEAGAIELFHATNGEHAATFPATYPMLRLDRIYVRGFQPLRAEVLTGKPWSSLSDHAALYGEVELVANRAVVQTSDTG